MKGFVFTEFLEMVENRFGFEVADEIVTEEKLDSKGIYSSIGTYDHKEMVVLVSNLSQSSGIPVPDLLKVYGKYLFGIFKRDYQVFFQDVGNSFDFLERVDSYIHIEVKKLYPQAELPKFDISRGEEGMTMIYNSSRKMSDLAMGLIEACMEHYGDDGILSKTLLDENGESVKIMIKSN